MKHKGYHIMFKLKDVNNKVPKEGNNDAKLQDEYAK